MPHLVQCPECSRTVRVPDDLIGQAVRCPTCRAQFPATALPDEGAAIQAAAPPETPAPLPDLPAPPPRDFVDYSRDRATLRRRALDDVQGPATGLIVTAILGIIVQIGSLIFTVGTAMYIMQQVPPGTPGPQAGELALQFASNAIGMVVGVTTGIVVLIGARKMKALESYGFAMASSILALIPCISPCCFLGLPIGIWALVVINRPEIKDAFDA